MPVSPQLLNVYAAMRGFLSEAKERAVVLNGLVHSGQDQPDVVKVLAADVLSGTDGALQDCDELAEELGITL